ncbi:ABC transporter ATP-binding protein [Halomontanus rarus]|uniref:ABC transporter ATP-binding protein n=1 Tax=Halomontanus rarus TaxID=3034020 RepID=UPI0023E8E130|nr:sn-glycerol-3-phosphate ABC transporter ATP-binding protein UgpC [Halovivax sp. TS33]
MSEIDFESVTKVYDGDVVAVDDFNLTIESGEFLTLVGPSGSGKSTLLRMVAGLEDVTEGTIAIGGETVNKLPPRNRDIAMVFQSYALYPHLSVRENMSFGLKRSTNLSNEAIAERVEEAASMMGISELLDDRPKQLSGGQRQRVATGRAIVRKPAVFLFDEPLSNLDAKLRKHMRTELKRIQQELDTTSIYVTHDQEEAMTMSDRIAILNYGELQQVGTPREVYDHPANLFVAEFIGSPSMNIFDVRYESTGDGTGRLTGDIDLEIGDRAPMLEARETDRFKLGIRPENIHVTRDDTNAQGVEVFIDLIEPLGRDDLLYFSLDRESSERIVSELDVEDDAESEDIELDDHKAFIEADSVDPTRERITLTINTQDVHIFDAETGENVMLEEPKQEQPASTT